MSASPAAPTATVAATRRVAAWLTHMGVSTHAFDDTLGLISPLLTVHRLHARVVDKVMETPSACTLVLQAGAAFRGLVPGQFVMIGVVIDGVRHRRAYSPRSIEGRRDHFAITVQRQSGGRVSNHVHDRVQPGDILEIEQAGGDFVLPTAPVPELLMIAGGSGITPIMSMLEHLRRSQSGTHVTLVYFARSATERIFGAALQALADRWPQLRYVPVDNSVNTAEAGGSAPQALLAPEMLARVLPHWTSLPAYCCGPAPLMDAARDMWKAHGIAERLKLEAFAPSRPSGDPLARHRVSIVRETLSMAFEAPGSETLLVAGEQAGHTLKHGCRQGICHECTCRLNSGSVRDLTTGERIDGHGQPVRLCVSSALSDLSLESLN